VNESVTSDRPIPARGAEADEIARDPQHALLLRQHVYDMDRVYSRMREHDGRLDTHDIALRELRTRILEHHQEVARLAARQTEQQAVLLDLGSKLDRVESRQEDIRSAIYKFSETQHVSTGLLTAHVQEEAESQAHLTVLFHRAIRVLLAVFAALSALVVSISAHADNWFAVLKSLFGILG